MSPFDVFTPLLFFSRKLVFTEILAPLSLACLDACLSNSLLFITTICCFFEFILISFPSGEKIFAHSISLSNVFCDGSIPNSFNAFLLTNPPQCSGLPTSNPSSKTKTE